MIHTALMQSSQEKSDNIESVLKRLECGELKTLT